jgi:hypothetical protein
MVILVGYFLVVFLVGFVEILGDRSPMPDQLFHP